MRALILVDLADGADANAVALSDGSSVMAAAVASSDAIAHILNAADVALDTDSVRAEVQDEAAAALSILWSAGVGLETQARLNGGEVP